MRNRHDRLLAGTVLALIVAAPMQLSAGPRVDSVGPPPPSLNGHNPIFRQREAAPVPPAPPQYVAPAETRHVAPTAPPEEQRVQAPPAAPAPREAQGGIIKSTLDKIMAASDGQISERLRAVIASKQLDRRIENAGDRQAIETFYAGRNYAPLWIRDGELTARAKDAIVRLKAAADEGLDTADYPVPDFGGSADATAEADIKLTHSVLTFARQMEIGRIAPTRVAVEIDYGNHTPEPGDVLRKISGGGDINATLDSFDPPHDGFRALKRKLAEVRANSANASADDHRIADGAPIKPGAKDPRVPQLRSRLKTSAPGETRMVVREHGRQVVKLVKADELVYDKALYNAVRNIQANADIKPSGVVDSKTIAAINGPKPGQQVDTVLANMERWRWLPRDLGATYVMVNVPDFTLKVVNDHRVAWRTKIVAGKPQTPTPLTSASMDTVIVNPSWYVPQSIIQNELLPQYASDPNIFDRMGLEVRKGPDGNINVVQPPGAANALGRIKFNFPNKFQVYLHDTPEKSLFKADRRAYSHGCMRVEDPTMFGQVMLHLAMNGPTPDSRQLYSMFGQEEKIFKLAHRPSVHLTYQTAFVDDEGKLQLRDDIYGMDARIHSILHSDERKIADVPPPQDPKRDVATAKSNQEILQRVERREALNPFKFFEQLFR
jgi:murein L,D-transpeptidase YcbB/YkuD